MGVSYVFEAKDGRTYKETYRDENPLRVYEGLAHCLIAKKIDECLWIKRIVKKQRYDGYVTIVFYEDGGRRVYTVER